MAPTTRKSSDAENSRTFGKSRIASVTNIMRGASRRRRDRVYTKSTQNIKDSIHRLKIASAALVNRDLLDLPTPPTSPRAPPRRMVKEVRLTFPSILKRPPGRAVPTPNLLAALGPDFPTAEFARDSLQATGLASHLWRVTQSIEGINLKGIPHLPAYFNLGVGDVSAPTPDRLLAVYGPTVNGTRTYTLMPVHDVVLASHCFAMTPLYPTGVTTPEQRGDKVEFPTYELEVPHPDSMRDLVRYLYLNDRSSFLASLLPMSASAPPASSFPGETPIICYAHLIAQTFSAVMIMRHMAITRGMWQNMCFLGIRDDAAWQLLNIGWKVLLRAFAESTNQEEALKNILD